MSGGHRRPRPRGPGGLPVGDQASIAELGLTGLHLPHPARALTASGIACRAYAGDVGLTAKSDVTMKTKARITLHVPRRVRSFGIARFRGSPRGKPLPPGGVTLELQAHQPGRGWRTVKTTRTRKGGRYATRYRFNSRAGRFTFRIHLRPNDSYPYSRATSRALRIRVG